MTGWTWWTFGGRDIGGSPSRRMGRPAGEGGRAGQDRGRVWQPPPVLFIAIVASSMDEAGGGRGSVGVIVSR